MAYNPYLPTGYYVQNFPQVAPQQNSNPIVWVQGLEGAKAYPVGANNSVLLMDSEENVFYIKSSDSSGMPMPLRVFDYVEREDKEVHNDYITRKEFEDAMSKLEKPKKTKVVEVEEDE